MTTPPDPALARLVEAWRRWDGHAPTLQEVERLVEAGQWAELGRIMAPRLQFGTAGIRGRMGPGFGQMNDLVIIQVHSLSQM